MWEASGGDVWVLYLPNGNGNNESAEAIRKGNTKCQNEAAICGQGAQCEDHDLPDTR